ncbi:hypothetical protein JK358_20910 [Nocardia sp. 2]|uniref:Integral membrane protein n=1 Tax=Nocardia acididurans TaxID=2802282 RepID=A0ABS1M9Y5_9NOCA|nr:hypothetical protein [Nocardia acididurans]
MPLRSSRRSEFSWVLGAATLVGLAALVPQIMGKPWRDRLYAGAAPLFGEWLPHLGWGTGPAIAIAALVIVRGPAVARRLPWRNLVPAVWLAAVAWAFALALIDGWQRGFAGRLTTRDEYLSEVAGVTDIAAMLRGFSDRILDFQPDSWTTHVSGHPPGALLVFVLLDRIGLGGGAWASALCLFVGAGAVAAVLVTLRALGAEESARAAAPFLVLAPAAIWIAVSADALFAGVTAWAVALLAIATRQREGWVFAALGAGLAFGFGLYLSYGLVLMAVPALAVLAARGFRPVPLVAAGMLLVVAGFTAAGFWWFDGYHLVVERYYQGIASERPYPYWVWANLAAAVCAVGLAVVAALPRVFRGLGLPPVLSPEPGGPARSASGSGRERLARWRATVEPAALVAAAGLLTIALADLSGLSKAETERIWLPFEVWLLAGTALLPRRDVRVWLTVQAIGVILLNHLILTNW